MTFQEQQALEYLSDALMMITSMGSSFPEAEQFLLEKLKKYEQEKAKGDLYVGKKY